MAKTQIVEYQPRTDGGASRLLENPEHLMSADLRAGWTKRVCNENGYTVAEGVPVDASGFPAIPWPQSENGLDVDVLLATATAPDLCDGHYPSPEQIAAAWTDAGKNYVDYFHKNRACGIKTCQDDDIEACLNASKQQSAAVKGAPERS